MSENTSRLSAAPDRYAIDRELGAGHMVNVYLATASSTSEVALKVPGPG